MMIISMRQKMMKTFKLVVTSICAIFFTLGVLAFELAPAINKDDNRDYYLNVKSKTGNRINWFIQSENYEGYFTLDRSATLLGFYSLDGSIKMINNNSGWPLITPSTCDESDIDCDAPWWSGRWSEQEFIEPKIIKRLKDYNIRLPFTLSYGDEVAHAIGCLESTPLRYGDIEGDGQDELVLLLKNSLVVFSPAAQKVVFSSVFNYPDFVTWQTMIDDGMRLETPTDNTPQYGSRYEYEQDRNAIIGYRAYAKLYVQDFDGDARSDLVLWRKFYQSRLYGDNVKGFEKLSDSYLHYKKVNGVYELQETAPETIQGWLTAKNQTWQSGFPSKSECAGQEGQLIPEMHDPLLNDPDVLK